MRSRNREEMTSSEYTDEILKDDYLPETHTDEENLDGHLTDAEIQDIWAKHMQNFVPEDMLQTVIEYKQTEALFETINHKKPTLIRGAYYVLGGNAEKTISMVVYDPNRDVVYKRKGVPQGIILFNSTVPGEYAFVMSNRDAGKDLTVSFALHTDEE